MCLNDGLAALDNPDGVIVMDADIISTKARDYVLRRSLIQAATLRKRQIGTEKSPFGQANIAPCGYFQMFAHASRCAANGRGDGRGVLRQRHR
jgi:hypothetical protein